MDGILSGFPFSRKKDIAAPGTPRNSDPKNSDVKNADLTKSGLNKSDPKNSDPKNSNIDRSDSMRLTKNDPAPGFNNDMDSMPDSISSFNSGMANDSGSRVTELARAKASPTAVIGPKIMFKGELTGEEDLLIQGKVEGSIDLKGNHLTIGSQGVIKANVAARTITVEGSVEGDIVAAEHIAIKSASRVKGNLKAERVTLEDGAKFRGSIDMDMDADAKTESKSSYTSPLSSPKEPKTDIVE
jgi:cytoskeletal protein CcmA (bactofilin family)